MLERLEIAVPDLADFEEAEVVEVHVSKGDLVEFDDLLVSIESDKATMEIPATAAGVVAELRVSEGDRVSEGSILVVIEHAAEVVSTPEAVESATNVESEKPQPPERADTSADRVERVLSPAAAYPIPDRTGGPHASPLIKRYARELGVPITDTAGSGAHGRILIDDLKQQVRQRFSGGAKNSPGPSGAGIPPMPAVDHGAYGPVREQKLTRIQKVSGPVLHRSWLNVPHVTQYDVADVTDLEIFRRDCREAASQRGLKLSPLLFVMKAVVIALAQFPTFRASLAKEGDRLWIKEYFHLGIAVDTDQGLVVPVIRDV
ncbi:MAG: 2-oxo acid dehydrogenase subunit E2, partial [Myxococcota bacterium]